ncbi:MAG: ATP-binding protein, partial [Myxococcota bacterium]
DWFESRAPDFAETLEVGWNALQDGFLPVEVALRQLPRTLLLGPRHLEFDYRSAGSSDEGLEVVIIVRDVSDRPEREAEQELLAALRHHARDPAGFGAFVRETNKLMHRVQRGEATPLEIHTAKGNVAVVGAASVSRALHALEVANETGSLDLALARATGAWERFKGRLTQVADLDRGPGVLITLEEYVDFRAKVRSRAPELLDDMQAWPFELLDARLEKLAEGALQVARRLGKPAPRIELDGERIRLDPDRYGPLWMALIHPIRNAVDHGIEAPEVRRAAGKAEQGLLRIQGRLNEGGSTLVLSIEDDGAGMDWRMIAEAVGKLDLQDPVEGGDLKMALFLHPVSTKSEATDISGQGLGLSALHRVVQDLHGTIQIESQPGKGTRVRALVPLHNPSERASPPNPLASGVDAVRRHYAAVGRRLTQVKEKAYVQAQDAARGLEAILESETLEEAREGAAALIMQLQRSDIQGQELSNVGDAIALLADFLGDGPRPLERLHELPSALDRLLPRQDLDARDIPEPRRGPAIDLFIGASQAPDRREKT